VIALRDILKVYQTGRVSVEALRGISLDVEEGEMVAIMGPSGSGKSTLMNIVGCLDVPTSGSYVLNGAEVGRLREDALAEVRSRNIGFVFQTFNLLPKLTALQNVELPMTFAGAPRGVRRRRARDLLEMVGLGDRMDHRPFELSGGQQQRVAIARSLSNEPSVILADEPTGNLDSRSGKEIMEVFERLHSEGITMVLITHERRVAQCAERIVYLSDGTIATREEALGLEIEGTEVDCDAEDEGASDGSY